MINTASKVDFSNLLARVDQGDIAFSLTSNTDPKAALNFIMCDTAMEYWYYVHTEINALPRAIFAFQAMGRAFTKCGADLELVENCIITMTASWCKKRGINETQFQQQCKKITKQLEKKIKKQFTLH